MRLRVATLSTRLSLLALSAMAVAAASDPRPSLGEEPVHLAQARSPSSSAAPVSMPPLPVPKPGRLASKPEANWPKTLPEAKAEAEAAAKPDVWSADEIASGKAHCAQVLRGIAAVVAPADPIKHGECGAAAPVELVSIGSNPEVAVSPPATLTCDMVVTLAEWLKEDVQPLAKSHFGESVIRIETMSSYSCRNAYGRKKTRLSEHGRANALDLGRFITEKGTEVSLLANWGPTERDIRAAVAAAMAEAEKRAAEEKAAREKQVAEAQSKAREKAQSGPTSADPAPAKPAPASPQAQTPLPSRLGFRPGTLIEGVPQPRKPATHKNSKSASVTLEPRSNLGRSQPDAPPPGPVLAPMDRKSEFLRAVHAAACRRFGTVLGPEANEAHRNHFHLDMAERRSGSFCE